jgi:hypothetical protein
MKPAVAKEIGNSRGQRIYDTLFSDDISIAEGWIKTLSLISVAPIDNLERVRAAVDRRQEFITGVQKLLDSCNTLNQACHIWPPLWELVPTNIKRIYHEIPTQRVKVTAPPDVDLDRLTAILTAVKLGV